MIPPAAPVVSIVICTRNRRDNPVKTVRSVLACSKVQMEVLLMDQSDGEETHQAIQPLLEKNAELRYFRLPIPGKPVALNTALKQAQGRFLLLTDDDCEPQPGWVEGMLAGFSKEEIGCVFGVVDPAPHDPKEGYITVHNVGKSFVVDRLLKARGYQGRRTSAGMGANIALRKSALESIQGWDPCIGPGSKFRGGDDHDIAMRLSLGGNHTAFSAEGRVTHYGFRRWSERYNDPMRYGYGHGAAAAKYLRCGIIYTDSLSLLSYHVREGIGHPSRGIRSSPCWAFVKYFFIGFRAAFRHPIDKTVWRFLPVDETETTQYGNHFANVVLRSELSKLSELDAEQKVSEVK